MIANRPTNQIRPSMEKEFQEPCTDSTIWWKFKGCKYQSRKEDLHERICTRLRTFPIADQRRIKPQSQHNVLQLQTLVTSPFSRDLYTFIHPLERLRNRNPTLMVWIFSEKVSQAWKPINPETKLKHCTRGRHCVMEGNKYTARKEACKTNLGKTNTQGKFCQRL